MQKKRVLLEPTASFSRMNRGNTSARPELARGGLTSSTTQPKACRVQKETLDRGQGIVYTRLQLWFHVKVLGLYWEILVYPIVSLCQCVQTFVQLTIKNVFQLF